ncbi:Disease resistance protein L6 [Linum perenne]
MSKLSEFPESGSLEILEIQGFRNRNEDLKIEKLQNLKVLKLKDYCEIGKIKGGTIGMMKELRKLNLCDINCDYNTFRQAIADIEKLSSLQILNVESPHLMDVLEGIKLPKSLKKLHTSSGFANVEELLELEEFIICDGTELVIPPAAGSSRGGDTTSSTIIPWIHSSKLKSMELLGMKRIIMVEIKDITMLPSSLTKLTISHVHSELIPNLKNLRNLTELKIWECINLEEMQGMGGLKSLHVLCIEGARKLTRINGLGNLMSSSNCKLTTLYISECPLLREVVTFEQQDGDDDGGGSEGERERYVSVQIESLVKMEIEDSPSIDWSSIPKLSKFPMLKELKINNIGLNINEESARQQGQHQLLEGLENLQELVELSISNVDSKGILNLKNLVNLTELKLSECPNLKEIHVTFEQQDDDDGDGGSEGERERYVLVQTESLVTMKIKESPSIDCRSMPRLSKFPMLKELKINNIGLNINEKSTRQQGQHQLLEGLENLQELVELSISNVDSKGILNLKNLVNLTELKLSECPNLEEIHGMGGLKSLQVLRIDGAEKLIGIHGLGNLMSCSSCKLTKLYIDDCPLLRKVVTFEQQDGDDDGGGSEGERERYVSVQIESLVKMEIEDSPSIDWSSIPKLSKFPMLKELKINNIGLNINEELARQQGQHQLLEGLENLQELVELSISNVDSKGILNLKNLVNLTELKLSECPNLEEIHGMGGLKSLQVLRIDGAEKLIGIHGLGNLMSSSNCELTLLYIDDCPLLREVVTFEQQDDDDGDGGSEGERERYVLVQIESLVTMKIKESPSIDCRSMPKLSKFPMLKELKINIIGMNINEESTRQQGQHQLLEGLENLQELVELSISNVDSKGIMNLKNLVNLTELKLSECPNLEEIHVTFEQQDDDDGGGGSEGERERDVLVQIESLVRMKIKKSPSIDWRSIPRLSKFPMLQYLTVKNINEESASQQGQHQLLEGLENLRELVQLKVSNVDSKRILNLKNLVNLTNLELSECPNLEEIHGMEGLKSLEVLCIEGARKLTRIHGLGNLMSSSNCELTLLYFCKCPLLREVVTFEQQDDDGGGDGDGDDEDFLVKMEILEIPSIGGGPTTRLSKLPMVKYMKMSELRMVMKGTENTEDLFERKLLFSFLSKLNKRWIYLALEDVPALLEEIVEAGDMKELCLIMNDCLSLERLHIKDLPYSSLCRIEFDLYARKTISFDFDLSSLTTEGGDLGKGMNYHMRETAVVIAFIVFYKLFWRRRGNSDNSNDSPSTTVETLSRDSSSVSLLTGEYDVFLSFRGPDTRHNVTDIIYRFLSKLKIRTFKDDDELRKGEGIWPNLVQAIGQSKVYVLIISEHYAHSKWCLKELVEIVQQHKQDKEHIILPIFYMVDPGDVRHQTGPYQSAFQQHKKRKIDEKTIQSWKDALNEVGSLTGWHIKSKEEEVDKADLVSGVVWPHLSKTINTIATDELVGIDDHVEQVVNRLNLDSQGVKVVGLHATDELVGIDDHVEQVVNRLNLDSQGVKVVGLHGIGGIGKTTLATTVYNMISTCFDRCSFVKNIREMQQQSDGVLVLQRKLISNILRKDSVGSIIDINEGKKIIRDSVSQFKVLIVLDDVDEKFKSEEVLGDLSKFVSGTRFIITSRDIKILRNLTGDPHNLYEVNGMDEDCSLKLFCKHAFKKDFPLPGFEALSKSIVSTTGGLPLSLKVVESLLFLEEEVVWKDKLEQLRNMPEEEVMSRLMISYSGLGYEAQQIFLDIACFYIGTDKEFPSYMWSGCNFHPISNINLLVQRSMVKIGDDNEFEMHDQLRDMGREIIRQESIEYPWKRSRIWSNEVASELLLDNKGPENG